MVNKKFSKDLEYKKWYYMIFQVLVQFLFMSIASVLTLLFFTYFYSSVLLSNLIYAYLFDHVCLATLLSYLFSKKYFTKKSNE